MRICFILSSLRLSGGVQAVIEYANRLTARDFEVSLVAPGCSQDPEIETQVSPRIRICLAGRAPAKKGGPARLLQLAVQMARTVPRSDVLVSTHTPTTLVSLLSGKIMRKGRCIWLFQDYREMFAGRPVEMWLMRNALRWHRCAMVDSEYSRQELRRYAKGSITVVGVGLSDQDLLQPAPEAEIVQPPNPPAIMYLGDERPRKGFADFLQAAEIVQDRVKNVRLWVASKNELNFRSSLPYDYLHRPSRQELAWRYARCSVFVSSSWREGFGLPPLEAMACGAPVVLTDSGGVREYAETERNCLMVPARHPAALAQAIIRVLSDQELAQHLRRNGPPTAARFSWESAVDRFQRSLPLNG